MKRKIKAWAVVDHEGKVLPVYQIFIREDMAKSAACWNYDTISVPCTITYEVPKKRRKGK